jgi:hypothetical protein
MVFFGFLTMLYAASNCNIFNRFQFVFIGGLLISYLLSALLTANYERVFHGLIFILINCGVGLALLSVRKIYWFGLNFNYIVILYFAINLLAGIDPRLVFTHTSYNSISIILITSCIVMYIFNHIEGKEISIFPALLTLFFCVWSLGRGGIISSFFLFIGIVYYKYPDRFRNMFLLLLALLLILSLFEIPYDFAMSYISTIDAVSLAVERSKQVEPRFVIFNDYVNNLSLYNFMFGVNIFENPTQSILDVEYNFHNSFLNLHSRMGFYALIVIGASLYSLFLFSRNNKLYFILFSTLIIRCSTDGFVFFESFDFIYYYFVFYAFSVNFKFKYFYRIQ